MLTPHRHARGSAAVSAWSHTVAEPLRLPAIIFRTHNNPALKIPSLPSPSMQRESAPSALLAMVGAVLERSPPPSVADLADLAAFGDMLVMMCVSRACSLWSLNSPPTGPEAEPV